ncbi:cupin domain-containing protein [Pseudomonadales bacterium]|nr:cupin domain-containing protein [Pseudomonadales bacterium]
MKSLITLVAALMLSQTVSAESQRTLLPAELSQGDIAGAIFERPDMIQTLHADGHVTLDVTSFVSSDQKFSSGMYKSGKTRLEVTEPYGVDEFMYFLAGSVTLTSDDGTVQTVEAGEGVTIAKEWTGIWETDGYTKIWVIYAATGQ